jgi:hypothetical protein
VNLFREEDKFRDQEADLRGADLTLQNSMIKFSQFLQENEKKKNEADAKRNEENKKIDQLRKQIDKKKEQYQILLDKQNRISLKVTAMKKYEAYLESVKECNPDEYQELSDILSRYWTLKNSNTKLNDRL